MTRKLKNDCYNTKISIKKNYIYNLLYQMLTLIVPLITAPYTSRIFGADGIGIQSYTNSIAAYFILFASLGLGSYGQREIAMNRDDLEETSRLFWEIELLSVFTTCLALSAWVVLVICSTRYSLYYGVLSMSIAAVAFDISWFFSGLEMFRNIVLRNSVLKIIGVIILFTLVKQKEDLLLFMGLTAATGLIGNLSMWTYLPGILKKTDIRTLHAFRHFKYTVAYFIPTIATSVYTVMDKTMIGVFTTEKENGYYEQATKIIRMGQALLLSLNTVMSSRMSYLFAKNREKEIKEGILNSFDFLLFLAIPLMFGITAIAKGFVPWFFGLGYDRVVVIMCCMSPLPLTICISNVLGCQYLTPSGQRVRSSKGILAGACVNFACNLILIPRLGAVGAAIASLIAEAVISVIYVYMSKGYIAWKNLWDRSWKRFVAGGIMMMAVYHIGLNMNPDVLSTSVQIFCGIMVYGAMLILLNDSFALKYIGIAVVRIKNKFGK